MLLTGLRKNGEQKVIRDLYTSVKSVGKVEDAVNTYRLNNEEIHGVRWSGLNFYSVKQIIGYNSEGIQNGKLHVFGRPINVGDFVYTNVGVDRISYGPIHGLFGGNLEETEVFIINDGDYRILPEE
ncbi:hypothetical protein D3C87_796210 [compost metagenome]